MVTASTDGRSGLRSNTAQRHTPSGLLDTFGHMRKNANKHTHCSYTQVLQTVCVFFKGTINDLSHLT